MTLVKREHPEARAELREAAFWYDDQQLYLGDDFYDAIDATIQRVLDWPDAAPVFPGWDELPVVRSASVSVFPYRVIYYLTDTSMVILAYAHHRRKPGYWQHRLDG
ncbi:type II toxin-antitoxin system RelE/ParE family toxin [Populibacterium corticicola]|uniref:Type II toxin-antitoxin system RelE/ParE family toxin n=1 Tax=Populibacterium corticicola TaxID=1812826 RepID=A0ABW5XJ23_9MICO